VKFGEVVLEPPTLSAKPRQPTNTPTSQVNVWHYLITSYILSTPLLDSDVIVFV